MVEAHVFDIVPPAYRDRGAFSMTGYLRTPTISGETIVFVTEDDLWCVSNDGGRAHRISANPGRSSHPVLSPDGESLAFVSEDEGGMDVYGMATAGGAPARRLTFHGTASRTFGWSRDGSAILYATDAAQAQPGDWHLWEVGLDGAPARPAGLGHALSMATSEDGARVLWRNGGGRLNGDPAWWKRYRGGRAGQLWIDADGSGNFERLIELDGDLGSPMWLGDRVFFLSDHEGVGNVYSCTAGGDDLRRHTDHGDYYVRSPKSDGRHVVYACGAELYVLAAAADAPKKLAVETGSTRPQRNRKFVAASRFLDHYALHPGGHSLAVTTRGKPFTFPHWEGAVVQHGTRDGVRYRFTRWFPDGERLLAVTDVSGEEELAILGADGGEERVALGDDIGRIDALAIAPAAGDRVALTNHRNEILIVDIGERTVSRVDASRYGPVPGIAWSPDGRFLAYSLPASRMTSSIRIHDLEAGESFAATTPDFRDVTPKFDPRGENLYFLSIREFDPVYDQWIFDLGFPRAMRIMALPLRRDLRSPFEAKPRPPEDESNNRSKRRRKREPVEVRIDRDGILDRLVACPITEANLTDLEILDDKIFFTSMPVRGSRDRELRNLGEPSAHATLCCYDLIEQHNEVIERKISDFTVASGGDALAYRRGYRLRVVPASKKAKRQRTDGSPSRENGWIDLGRLKVSVDPGAEWRQIFHEAWRLQRDHFWNAEMSGIDWVEVRERYRPILQRVSTRTELSDLLWELHGELGTSHAYEMGGDYRRRPRYGQGFLGADFRRDDDGIWFIEHLPRGDSWNPKESAPLSAPGVNADVGERIVAVGGCPLSADLGPEECLVHMAKQRVQLTLGSADGSETRDAIVTTLGDERPLRYRAWVEANRARVHDETDGRVGYVHIPDMGPAGFAEFHRYFVVEQQRDGLIIDVRYNRGGHVSQLLIEKLLRRRIAWVFPRWAEPNPYPMIAPAGPLVALTNERAGSDGDIFTHVFKAFGIGPVIGTRTWGGVVGINPRHRLVDGSLTTQPEYPFWWWDAGFGVENRGSEPDIEVEIRPQDYAAGRDTQLDRGLAEITKLLEENPPRIPDPTERPSLPSSKLPERK